MQILGTFGKVVVRYLYVGCIENGLKPASFARAFLEASLERDVQRIMQLGYLIRNSASREAPIFGSSGVVVRFVLAPSF